MNRKSVRRRLVKLLGGRMIEALESRCLLSASFSGALTVPAGTAPVAVALGDFNHDGRVDLAVVNQGDGTVGILLGNGNGTYQPMEAYLVGSNPSAVTVGDFNRDGKLDLAVASVGTNSVGILLGAGNGTFGVATAMPTGSQPISVAVGDFNRDGKPDLAVTNFLGNSVGILLGDGDGNFQAMSVFPTENGPSSVAVGDFNRDGILDLAVASQTTGSVDILQGDSFGNFGASDNFLVGGSPSAIVTADFNHDGRLDLAFTETNVSAVGVVLGAGDGTFGAVAGFATGVSPEGIALGDFNGDGKLDLAVTNFGSNTVGVLGGAGNGAFGAMTSFGTGALPVFVAAGDLNGDGRTDLVAANSTASTISVLLNSATPVAAATQLQFVQQPVDATAGATLAPVTVQVLDADGALVTGDHGSVTLAIATGPDGGKIVGTVTVQAVNGVATFSHVSLPLAGTYTLLAKRTGSVAGTSSSFAVTAAAAAKLRLMQQPTSAVAGAAISPAVTVEVVDAFGNVVLTDTSSVTMAVLKAPKNANDLGGTVTVAAVNGVATFGDLSLTTAGSYMLEATDGNLTLVKSKTITIRANASSPHLVLTQQPDDTVVGSKLAPKLVVKVEDAFGNVITTDHSAVTLAVVAGPNALSGTLTVKASHGVATFSNVKSTLAGNYTLEVSDAALGAPVVDFAQVITQGVTSIALPKTKASYPAGAIITLATTIKSTASTSVPLTVDAVLMDDTNTVLATATPTAAGSVKFTLNGLVAGTYTLHVSYAGDANHTASASDPFELLVV
jgi:hypothetical protein